MSDETSQGKPRRARFLAGQETPPPDTGSGGDKQGYELKKKFKCALVIFICIPFLALALVYVAVMTMASLIPAFTDYVLR